MINPLDSRLPAFKSYMTEHRLNSGTTSTAKSNIDQAAIGSTEQTNVTLDLDAESAAEQEAREKKKKEEQRAQEEAQKKAEVVLSDAEIKTRNMRLLIAL